MHRIGYGMIHFDFRDLDSNTFPAPLEIGKRDPILLFGSPEDLLNNWSSYKAARFSGAYGFVIDADDGSGLYLIKGTSNSDVIREARNRYSRSLDPEPSSYRALPIEGELILWGVAPRPTFTWKGSKLDRKGQNQKVNRACVSVLSRALVAAYPELQYLTPIRRLKNEEGVRVPRGGILTSLIETFQRDGTVTVDLPDLVYGVSKLPEESPLLRGINRRGEEEGDLLDIEDLFMLGSSSEEPDSEPEQEVLDLPESEVVSPVEVPAPVSVLKYMTPDMKLEIIKTANESGDRGTAESIMGTFSLDDFLAVSR